MEGEGTATAVLKKAEEVSSFIKNARTVDEVTSSLHSLADIILPHRSSTASDCLYCRSCQNEHLAEKHLNYEKTEMWNAFYKGPAFRIVARILLLDVASNWLACLPLSLKKHVYDAFFTLGLASEVVHTLVSFLQRNVIVGFDCDSVQSNVERLLHLCLLENNGVMRILEELVGDSQGLPMTPRMVQVIVSIPDKARPNAPKSLSSFFFFKNIVANLLDAFPQRKTTKDGIIIPNELNDAFFVFVGETFSRICRRGSTDVVLSQLVSRVVGYVKGVLQSSPLPRTCNAFDSGRQWSPVMGAIKDPYAFEKISEHLLIKLDVQNITDIEAYWVLSILYSNNFLSQPSLRALFVDKFLLWKVFPLRCGRWIIQFAILQCEPQGNVLTKGIDIKGLLDFVNQAASLWSKREFVRLATLEQQIYVSGLLGLSLPQLSKANLESSQNTMHAILHGVGCRLESPVNLTRKMASCIALVFSQVIDPKNPLYIDDDMRNAISIDWEFGMTSNGKPPAPDNSDSIVSVLPEIKPSCKKLSKKMEQIDPDEIIDPAVIKYNSFDSNDTYSEGSHSSDDSSLQPYDLDDDYADLTLSFSNLADLTAALRKSDDIDRVERALHVAERLVRGSPDELRHVAGDLTRTLIHLRCSDIAVEGEEDSAEEKRHRSMVAVLATSPFQSVQVLNQLLFSPNLDTSQRLLILDVMVDAAMELAATTTIKPKIPSISDISQTHPWSLPPNSGTATWKRVLDTENSLHYSYHYERELPPRSGVPKGKSRRWSVRRPVVGEIVNNNFPAYSAAFMLPAMEGFDKRRHGVDLLGRDYIVLGKLIHMLGTCMNCVAMHPESTLLAPPLLDMLKAGVVHGHKEAYVRRAALFAASSIVGSVHPSYVASALREGNGEICLGIEWIRKWAVDVAESDVDKDCYAMAISCLKSHSEMGLQVSRALEVPSPSAIPNTIQIPDLSKGVSSLKLHR